MFFSCTPVLRRGASGSCSVSSSCVRRLQYFDDVFWVAEDPASYRPGSPLLGFCSSVSSLRSPETSRSLPGLSQPLRRSLLHQLPEARDNTACVFFSSGFRIQEPEGFILHGAEVSEVRNQGQFYPAEDGGVWKNLNIF